MSVINHLGVKHRQINYLLVARGLWPLKPIGRTSKKSLVTEAGSEQTGAGKELAEAGKELTEADSDVVAAGENKDDWIIQLNSCLDIEEDLVEVDWMGIP